MGLTIRDVESSFLQAQAEVQQWQAEFLAEWHQPEIDLMMAMLWQGLDPRMKQYLKAVNPAAFERVEGRVKQFQDRGRGGSNAV